MNMLVIRFARVGKKNKAQFKIMLQENTTAPGGRHVEILGSYDPHKKEALLKEERIKHWISKGAKASDTVHNLLVSKGIVSDKKRAVKIPQKTEKANPEEEAKAEEKKPEEKKEVKTKEIREEKPAEETKKGESKSEAKK